MKTLSRAGIRRSIFTGAILGVATLASAVVIQGEFSPGIYNNYIIDSLGRMPVVLAGSTGGPMDVAVTSMPTAVMPTGASTEAKQDTGNSALAAMNAKLPTLVGGLLPVTGTITASPVTYSYRNLTANGTTLAKTGAGTLKRIVVNTAGVTSTITVYDSLTGTGTKIGTATSLIAQQSIDYDVEFANGLTVVAAGLTPADITVVYR